MVSRVETRRRLLKPGATFKRYGSTGFNLYSPTTIVAVAPL
jgi:hypothetical protein